MFIEDENNQGMQGGQGDGDGDEGDLQAQLATAQAELKKKEDEISKLKSKDLNFSSYRKKTEEEKKQIYETMTAKERLFQDQIDSLKGTISNTTTEVKTGKLKALSGGDADLEKEIQANFDRLTRDEIGLTAAQIDQRMDEAFVLTRHQKSSVNQVNPLNQFNPSSGGSNPFSTKKENYADTEDGQTLAKDLQLTLEKPKK